MTPAGSVIVAAAEILGCMTAATLLRPDVYYYSTSIAAEMDMRTTQVCFATPAAILTDVALHELFRDKYGLVHNVEPGYVEAKTPGIQATMLKVYRQMAFGCTVSLPLAIGALDSAAVFSPTQAMIDLEMNEALHKFHQGMEVTDETMALDLIAEMEFGTRRTYLDTDHTLEPFPPGRLADAIVRPHLLRPHRPGHAGRREDSAGRRPAVARVGGSPARVESEPGLVKELDRIVAAARRELLSEEDVEETAMQQAHCDCAVVLVAGGRQRRSGRPASPSSRRSRATMRSTPASFAARSVWTANPRGYPPGVRAHGTWNWSRLPDC